MYICYLGGPQSVNSPTSTPVNSPTSTPVDSPTSTPVDSFASSTSKDSIYWVDNDVKLLIATWIEFKDMFDSKKTKKQVFELIAQEFNKKSKMKATGEQCLRKWGKLMTRQKEKEDHNNKSGNQPKTWKFYNELSECTAKDISVKPIFNMESSNSADSTSSTSATADDVSSNESEPGSVKLQKRCQKRPRARNGSGREVLEFLKEYCCKKEKADEDKLNVLKEIKDEKKNFYDKFFKYLDKSQ